MSVESKVGAFILLGLTLLASAVFLLGDYTLERRYQVYVLFHDVANLSPNAPVKLSGVEVGKVRDIQLVDTGARVICSIRRGVTVYRDSVFTIGATGLIGSKFLEIDQGRPESGVMGAESTVTGVEPADIQKAVTNALNSISSLVDELNARSPRGTLAQNLRDTVAEVRELTANLNDLIQTVKPHVEQSMEHVDSLTAKLDTLLDRTNMMMASLNTSSGTVGALLHDQQMKQDVADAVHSVKDVLSRVNQFKIYWNLDWRYENALRTSHADVGLRIVPHDNRYYYLGVENFGSPSDKPLHGPEFEQINRVDGLLGWTGDWWDVGVGAIRSAGGAQVTLTPFYFDPLGKHLEFLARAYDFGRNRTISGKVFNKPEYDFGILAKINRFIGIGWRAEDVATTPRYETWANVSFEDKDIAYLFGLVTFGAAGSKGRSSNGGPSQP